MYLIDIDVDFLVDYVPYKKETCLDALMALDNRASIWLPPDQLVTHLAELGFDFSASQTFSFDDHGEAFDIWCSLLPWQYSHPQEAQNLPTLVHLDNHHDLYGCRDFYLCQMDDRELSCANYIWYALKYGLLKDIIWVVPCLNELLHSTDQLMFIHNKKEIIHQVNSLVIPLAYGDFRGEPCTTSMTVCELDFLQPAHRPVVITTIAQSKGFTPPKTYSYAHYIHRLISNYKRKQRLLASPASK